MPSHCVSRRFHSSATREQVDAYEAELEQINSAKKKKKDAGAQKWEELIERCRFHEERLELVLRLIDNESLSPEDVDNIKDQLDYLLEQVPPRYLL